MKKHLKILLIDDDELDRLSIVRALDKTTFNCTITELAYGEQTLEILKNQEFDCLLVDYRLPDLDGITLLKKIRLMGVEIPALFITSDTDENLGVEAIKAGASDFIPKALFTPEGLDQSLRNAFNVATAKKQLKETQEKLSVVVSNLPVALFSINTEQKITLLEGKLLDSITLKTKNYKGKEVTEIFYDSENLDESIKKALVGQASEITLKQGQLHLEIFIVPKYNGEKIEGVLGSVFDITERILFEIETEKTLKLKDETARLKEVFLANMSHEIRTPMNSIIGFIDILLEEKLSAEQLDMLKTIKSSSDTLLVILNDILDFSKISAGKMTFENIDFNLKIVLENVLNLFKQRMAEKEIDFTLKIAENVPQNIIGDPTKLTQILTNLVGNSLKFTKNGEVVISITLDNNACFCFEVKDTGIGIPENKHATIFESFSQASNTTNRKYGGTGLGLSIVKKLVELQNGSIWVKSEEKKGSSFVFTLPYQISKNTTLISKANNNLKRPINISNLHVLLAEDNIINQKLAKRIFEKWGCKLKMASNGAEAVEMALLNSFDLIFMDIQMPLLSGIEATIELRKKGITTPIIAITAHVLDEEKQKCFESGMNDFITKPFKQHDLFDKIVKNTIPENNVLNKTLNSKLNKSSRVFKYVKIDVLKQNIGNDDDFLKEMIEAFLEYFPDYLTNFKKALLETNNFKMKELAHKMKSSLRLFGVIEAANLGDYIEDAVIENSPENLTDKANQFIEISDATIKELEAMR